MTITRQGSKKKNSLRKTNVCFHLTTVVALQLVVTFSCFQTNEYVKLCFVYTFWHHVSFLRSLESGKNATAELGKQPCQSLSCFSSPPAFTHSCKHPGWQRRRGTVKLKAMPANVLYEWVAPCGARCSCQCCHCTHPCWGLLSPWQRLCCPMAVCFAVIFVLSGALFIPWLGVVVFFPLVFFFFLPL